MGARRPQIHQLIPVFSPDDAMGQAAIAFRRALRHAGALGEVFAEEVAPGYGTLVRPVAELSVEPDDVVLYHHGIASSLASQLMHVPCRRGIVFHNITPARYYEGTRLHEALVAGRSQLAALAEHVEFSLAVSAYNARELEAAGHRDVRVVPLYVEPERFALSQADEATQATLRKLGRPAVLSVSRVVPHKRVDDLLSLHAELRRIAPRAHLVIVGGYAEGQASTQALLARAKAIGGVTFMGRVSHAQLVAAYKAADVYVSMSEHEGFGVPLIEAFAAELPVLAFGAAAVPETMGGHGVVFDEKHFAALAETVSQLDGDLSLRRRIVAGQRERLAAFSLRSTVAAFKRTALPLPSSGAVDRRPAAAPKRKRVAMVVQRYGASMLGGAESHARQVAQRLAKHVTVEVFTTTSTDHLRWDDSLRAGTSRDGAITVHRFSPQRERSMPAFNRLSKRVFHTAQPLVAEEHWLAEQGPVAPGLLDAITAPRFDAVAFFTFLYAPTVWGVPLVAKKALVVPTAHDEPAFAFHAFADVFTPPRELLCNTPEEVALIQRRFGRTAKASVVGVGVEAPRTDAARFRAKYHLERPYLLYVGRLEAGKGVPRLLELHAALVKRFHDAPDLVLAGAGELRITGDRVKALGRIDDQDKWDGLAGALAAVVPSQYESLSLLTLEAFAVGTPVLGNAGSDVVVGQLERSEGGLAWRDEATFIEAVRKVGAERQVFSSQALRYAARHTWPKVVDAWLSAIDRAAQA